MLVQEEGASMLGALLALTAGSRVMHFYQQVEDMRWSLLWDREKMQILGRGKRVLINKCWE